MFYCPPIVSALWVCSYWELFFNLLFMSKVILLRGLCPHKPPLFEAASNQLPSTTIRLSVGLPRCFSSLPCFLNKPRSHTHPRSRDSVAMPSTIRAIGSAPGTFMKQRNSRGGVYVASHLRRLAPTKIQQPNISV